MPDDSPPSADDSGSDAAGATDESGEPEPEADGSAAQSPGSGGGGAGRDDDGGPVGGPGGEGFRSREVVVPVRLYKTVTVFSTLFSAVLVVAGFVLLDSATDRAQAPLSEVDAALAGAGLACIVAGGVVYAFAARFRAPGMGKDKDAADEGSNDG